MKKARAGARAEGSRKRRTSPPKPSLLRDQAELARRFFRRCNEIWPGCTVTVSRGKPAPADAGSHERRNMPWQ
jgi:hypothetical protein